MKRRTSKKLTGETVNADSNSDRNRCGGCDEWRVKDWTGRIQKRVDVLSIMGPAVNREGLNRACFPQTAGWRTWGFIEDLPCRIFSPTPG